LKLQLQIPLVIVLNFSFLSLAIASDLGVRVNTVFENQLADEIPIFVFTELCFSILTLKN